MDNTKQLQEIQRTLRGGIGTGCIITKISNTIPTTTSAYTSGDNIGGVITCSGALRTNGGTAIIQDISIWDLSNQKSNITIHFWNASPSGTYTDNAAEVIAGDQAKYLGMYNITAADYVTVGAIATANLDYVGVVLQGGTTSSDIFYTIVTTSTPTYAANALIIKLGILQD